jgi:hypothetical protein cdiviTM7_00597
MLLTAGLLVSVFMNAFMQPNSARAADVTWDDRDLTYNQEKYTRLTDNNKIKQLKVPDKSIVFLHEDNAKKEVRVIYFPASEVSSLSSATYAVYSFVAPDGYVQTSTSTVSIESPSENSTGNSCDLQGLGWIICPLSNLLADAMDWMYGALQEFLKTQPLETTNQNSGIYLAWGIMRNISNVAFIAAFLVIIYSQITSIGIGNYGIKKLLPRLIIAAVLVNLSFTICAIALDLSNIVGYALQDTFMGIKNAVVTLGENTPVQSWGWGEVTTTVLSNGALGAGVAAAVALRLELWPMLVTALVGLGLTLLLVLLIMAARQALIIILIIISPLAFVCYLLPGTEKWFEKWRDLFTTMLIFFPAFAVAFGGAQLAGILIIQSATGANGGMMHILGMIVQVAPLALTPLILKLSGGVLNRVAGFVNDKNKGLYDRTKNWSKDRREIMKNQKLANDKMRRFDPNRLRRWADHNSRLRKERLDRSQKTAENSYRGSAKHKREDLLAKQTARRSELLSEQDANRYAEAAQGYWPSDMSTKRSLPDRISRGVLPGWSIKRDMKQHQQNSDLMDAFNELETSIAAEGLRKSNAQRQLNKKFAEDLLSNSTLQDQAAGNVSPYGKEAALASAISTTRGETSKSIEEAHQIMKHHKLSSGQRQDLALGKSVTTADGTVIDSKNIYVREAAIEEQIKYGTVTEVAQLLSELPPEFNSSAAAALAASGVKNKASFMGGKLIDDLIRGAINNRGDLTKYCAEWLEGGKYKAEDLASTDADGVKLLMEAINSPSGGIISATRRQSIKDNIDEILTNERLSSRATDAAKEQLRILQSML